MARRKKTEKRELSHEDIPRNTRATARRLLGRMARQWWKLLLVAGAALLSSASFTAIPLAVGMGIDRLVDAIRAFDGSAGVVETAAGALGLPVLLVAAAALFSSLMSYVQQYIIATVGEELTLSLRQDVSAKLNRLPLRYFDGHKTGDIMSRVTNDLEKVSSVMQVGLMQLVSSVFTIALAAAAMVMLSPRLFLVVLVSLALSMTATGYVSALAQRAYGGNMAAMGALTGKVEELYAGNRVVKVFNRQAAMLAAVVTWFSCYTAVMTSDKFVYLFGRVIPALSLVLSMTLRFVPKFQAQLQVVSEAQRCIGRDVSNGGVLQRLRNAITILSIMVTWSLENAIETADSMKSRGYGLPGRTAFSIYRFDSRDQSALSWLLYCGFFLCCGAAAKGFYWRYYPTARGVPLTPMTVCLQAVYLALCLMPVILNIRADREWGVLRKENEVQPCTKQ